MNSQHDDYFVRIDDTLVGRKAGGSARERARELQAERPVASLASRVLRRRTTERAWRKGAFGERFNGWLLDRLPEGWHVFHDVPVGDRGANIDHIVIGPSGWLLSLPAALSTGEVMEIGAAAAKPSTWVEPQRGASPPSATSGRV